VRLERAHEELLRSYIETASVSGAPNGAVVDLLERWFAQRGWETLRLESPRDPGLLNLVARRGPPGCDLVVSGHTDTVAPVAADWTSEPFRLEFRDGCYVGNGTADTKGPTVAAIVAATERIDAARLKRGIAFWFDHSEENALGGRLLKGSRELVEHARREGVRPSAMIVIEPTGLVPAHSHNGYAQVEIAIAGRAAHSSAPEAGDNAIERMAATVRALEELRRALRAEHDLPLNVGFVAGGREDQVNVVAEHCRVRLDFRCPPGSIDAAGVLRRIRELPEAAGARVVVEPIPALCGDPDLPLVRAAARASGREPRAMAYYTDAAAYQALAEDGALEEGLVVFGCGDIRYAHAPDERIAANDLREGIDVFAKVLEESCCA